MQRDSMLIGGATVAALALIAGGLYIGFSERLAATSPESVPASPPPLPEMGAPKPYRADDGTTELPLEHVYENGEHKFSGEIDKPGECFTLTADGERRADGTIALSFDMEEDAEEGCAFAIVSEPFSISVEGEENAEVEATFNGDPLRLVPPEEGNGAADWAPVPGADL